MQIPKPSQEDNDYFSSLVPAEPQTAADRVAKALDYVRTFPAKKLKPARKR